MSDNQHVFEIIRDIGYAIQHTEVNHVVWFNVKRDSEIFYTARCSEQMQTGLSETSRAIKLAYDVTRGMPDKRDILINELQEKIKLLETQTDEKAIRQALEDMDK